jgi:hypothetical protein
MGRHAATLKKLRAQMVFCCRAAGNDQGDNHEPLSQSEDHMTQSSQRAVVRFVLGVVLFGFGWSN